MTPSLGRRLPIRPRMSEIIPESIRHLKRQPNISSFHSISGQLSNPSTNEKQKLVKQL